MVVQQQPNTAIPNKKIAVAIGFVIFGGFGSILSFLVFLLVHNLNSTKTTEIEIAKIMGISFSAWGIIGALVGFANPSWCAQPTDSTPAFFFNADRNETTSEGRSPTPTPIN
ncbi:MAG: hypothetical protein COY58_02940 [Gammaproteobacteria bacterium CG_4_10_14_0_8_um_filter_38_16]|nr:MAG: hypothetical protein COY58_02940 [Gammaproteobacteria bacterium CG_4_10_14_0_8_um_filter_38_16]PJA03884.1 MAG: hypothetical protein COX72_03100 [Gammaproteobacteria bacterium CG_4_10_14_0_2_um_filter_38_22]PJB09502.1 MAG: hypothetical protein CO120_09705 [Gammaproteobacteria bacterium CG_4_9_14_3_um_filter_38_9]